MSDRAIIIGALIIGGAIVAASYQYRSRYALSAADNKIAWRMDTWSGEIDLCTARYLPQGPLVRCGALMILNTPPQDGAKTPPTSEAPAPGTPAPPASESPLDPGANHSL
jgi:hypothetical protein